MSYLNVHEALSSIDTNLTEVLEVTSTIFEQMLSGQGCDQGTNTFVNRLADGFASYTTIKGIGAFAFSEKGLIAFSTNMINEPFNTGKIDINVLIDSEENGKITDGAWFQYSLVTSDLFGLEKRDVQRISDMIKKFRNKSGN